MSEPELKLSGIAKRFGELEVLQRLDMHARGPRIISLLGPSGCGKTTLLRIVAGLIEPDAGRITTSGTLVSYVFQEPRLLPWRTVRENVALVAPGRPEIVDRCLVNVDLAAFAGYYPHMLSGGMVQRVSIARAFAFAAASSADLLLMDEPFKALDLKLKIAVIRTFLELWIADPRMVVFVTHDVEEAFLLGDVIHVLSDRPATVRESVVNPLAARERHLDHPSCGEVTRTLVRLLLEE